MVPLALGIGEGSELLQPLAVCMVFGLAFSVLVSLLLAPTLYLLAHRRSERIGDAPTFDSVNAVRRSSRSDRPTARRS